MIKQFSKIILVLMFILFFSICTQRTAYAANPFEVNFHVPVGQPIFSVANAKPGDQEQRTINVKNKSNSDQTPKIKGIRTGGVGEDPKLEHILSVVIKEGNTVLYGPKTVEDFFADSGVGTGIPLSLIQKNKTKTYKILVTFPLDAGNEYQGKSVTFNLFIDTFSILEPDKLVINEVFYHVDNSHWFNLTPDRRDDDRDLDEGGWYRDWFFQNRWWVFRKDFQWIELYNPTDKNISLKRWTLQNRSGSVGFEGNETIKARSFALVAKDNVTWRFWNLPRGTNTIELKHNFSNGLNPSGDHLILRDGQNREIDRMSWGNDTTGFTPAGTNPEVARGSSTERVAAGFDTNQASDWHSLRSPTPGR